MRYLIYCSLISLLTGCLAANKANPDQAVYDFGLNAETGSINTNIDIGKITAVDAIDHRRIRYRLNYQNPAQVFTYTQSRWASSPAELLAARVRNMVNTSTPSNCGIHLQIETFDHVFESPAASMGVVRIHASLYSKKSHQTLLSHMAQNNASARSADAEGGVAALDEATTKAVRNILEWANINASQRTECES